MARRPLTFPILATIVGINARVRGDDEWFGDDPDDLDRVARVLDSVRRDASTALEAACLLMARLSRAQAFGEGNKRTSLLAAQSVIARNLPPDEQFDLNDAEIARLLVRASIGDHVETDMLLAVERLGQRTGGGGGQIPVWPGGGRHVIADGTCGATTTKGRPCRRRGRCPYHHAT